MSDSEFHLKKEVDCQGYNWNTFADYLETCPDCNDGLLVAFDMPGWFRCTNCTVLLSHDFNPDNLNESDLEEWTRETKGEMFSDPC